MARHFQPDNRHAITDPYQDHMRWALSVNKGRVSDLFLTARGLDGHRTQIQQEISRMVSAQHIRDDMEGMTGAQVVALIEALDVVKSGIVSAAKACVFDFAKISFDFGTLLGPLYLKRENGQLFRDGKPE